MPKAKSIKKPQPRKTDIRWKEFNRRYAKQCAERDASKTVGAASDVRTLNADAFAKRKAELEERGLPISKPKTIGPIVRRKKFLRVKSLVV